MARFDEEVLCVALARSGRSVLLLLGYLAAVTELTGRRQLLGKRRRVGVVVVRLLRRRRRLLGHLLVAVTEITVGGG